MPKRSRGFWVCELCDLTFDRFEEVEYHERSDCNRVLAAGTTSPSSELQPTSFSQHDTMPPLSRAEVMQPSARVDYERRPNFPPRMFLMGMEEPSYLTESDTVACRSVELYQMRSRSVRGTATHHEQLVLKCAFCDGQQDAIVAPLNISSVGDSVRRIADHHIFRCRLAPPHVRDFLEQAVQKRTHAREQGGPSWHEEESNHRVLVDFCVSRCRELGIVDRYPSNSGISFRDVGIQRNEVPISDHFGSAQAPVSLHAERQAPTFRSRSIPESPAPNGILATPITRQPPHEIDEYSHRRQAENTARFGQSMDPTLTGLARTAQPAVPAGYSPSAYVPPSNFPFYQVPSGEWFCKYCSHVHPDYRDQNYLWSTPNKTPPPRQFIETHFSFCREFSRVSYSTSYDYHDLRSYAIPTAYGSMNTSPHHQGHSLGSSHSPGITIRSSRNETSTGVSDPEFTGPFPTGSANPQYHTLAVRSDNSAEDATMQQAIRCLAANDQSTHEIDGTASCEASLLVISEDRLLLTDYFFFIMKQLRMVRFSEADRRTRGGKREKIQVGYGGLQCIHCGGTSNARKFFWSNVDRLANSFAEIPSHIFKCRRCPKPVKDALMQLKKHHSEQMGKLPRGSQKVFFRRMWRRLHDEDPLPLESISEMRQSPTYSEGSKSSSFKPVVNDRVTIGSPSDSSDSEQSLIVLERSALEAAKALTETSRHSRTLSPTSRVLLAIPEDKEWLSDTDCFIRRQIEVFCATKEDIEAAHSDRKYPVEEGQIGIRCLHCAMGPGARLNAVAFPFSISGIYESVREFQRLHLDDCKSLPPPVKAKLKCLKGSSSLSSVLRRYYALSARALGLMDTSRGIRSGGESTPIGSQTALTFSDEGSNLSHEMKRMMREGSRAESSPASVGGPASMPSRKSTEPEEPGQVLESQKPASVDDSMSALG